MEEELGHDHSSHFVGAVISGVWLIGSLVRFHRRGTPETLVQVTFIPHLLLSALLLLPYVYTSFIYTVDWQVVGV